MRVPYARADFPSIRTEGYFYVDKTPFIATLEDVVEGHLVFLRPRRFGKSTLISTLASYYDIAKADDYDKLFGGLWIHEHPTPKKNAYLVLRFDFSPVASEGTTDEIRTSFANQVKIAVREFVDSYGARIPALAEVMDAVRSPSNDSAALISLLLSIARSARQQVYILIDEYDHFGNRLISDGKMATYRELVDSSGFLRSFYAAIKAFAGTNTVGRTFVTGVSPIVLDDLSSGFNIIKHISQHPHFNEMAGFTRAEVERAVDLMLASKPDLIRDPRIGDRDILLATLEEYYDGYRFAPGATQRMYNATLVLYFFAEVLSLGAFPRTMLDLNARTDYGRLYGLAKAATEHESGIRTLLEAALSQGEVRMRLVEQFGTRFPLAEAQVTSLFYYMGMLTFGPDAANEPIPTLTIPNRVMRELQWEYMGYALADNERIVVDMTHIEQALLAMAEEGDIQPLLEVFTKEVLERISNRDLGKFNEKIMKLMLMAYLCQTHVFHVASELEMKQGYCDLLLGLHGLSKRLKFGWIIEAKYVAVKAKPETHEQAIADGYAQIDKYMSDQGVVKMLTLGREIKAGVMVFVGSKRIDWYPWPRPEKPVARKKAPATATTKKTAKKA